jgi:hypothetical protein
MLNKIMKNSSATTMMSVVGHVHKSFRPHYFLRLMMENTFCKVKFNDRQGEIDYIIRKKAYKTAEEFKTSY